MDEDMTLEELKDILPKGTKLIIANDEGKPISQEIIGEYKKESTFETKFKELQEENYLIQKKYNDEYRAACLEEEYPSYKLREAFKRMGWKFYSLFLGQKGYRQAAQMLMHYVIWSHYWRAREDLETSKKTALRTRRVVGKNYCKRSQLGIDQYTENWLYSMSDSIDPLVTKSFDEDYGYKPKCNKYLEKGYTCYFTHSDV